MTTRLWSPPKWTPTKSYIGRMATSTRLGVCENVITVPKGTQILIRYNERLDPKMESPQVRIVEGDLTGREFMASNSEIEITKALSV